MKLYEDINEKDILYLDIETQHLITEFEGGWKKPDNYRKIKIAELGTLQNNEYNTYEEKNINDLIFDLVKAELIVGHNISQFDYEVLEHYYSPHIIKELRMKTFDTMLEFSKHTKNNAGWVGLDDIAKRNFGMTKPIDSILIPKMWRDGKHQEVKDYLLNDLKITEQFFLHGRKGHTFKYEHKIYGKSYGEREVYVKW